MIWENKSKSVANKVTRGALPEGLLMSKDKEDSSENTQNSYTRYHNLVFPLDRILLFLEPDPSNSNGDYFFLQFNGNHRRIKASEVAEGEDMIQKDRATLNTPLLISPYVVTSTEPQNKEWVHSARLMQPVLPDKVTGENRREPIDRFARKLDLTSAKSLFGMVVPTDGQNTVRTDTGQEGDPHKILLAALRIMDELLSVGPGLLYQTLVNNCSIQGDHDKLANLSDDAVRKRSKEILCEQSSIRVAILDGLQRVNGYARLLRRTNGASMRPTMTPIHIIVPDQFDADAGADYIGDADIACAQEVSRIQQRGLEMARGVRVLNAMVMLARSTATSLACQPWKVKDRISGDEYIKKQRVHLGEELALPHLLPTYDMQDNQLGREWHRELRKKETEFLDRLNKFKEKEEKWQKGLRLLTLQKHLYLECAEVLLYFVRDGASSSQNLDDVLTQHFPILSVEGRKMDKVTLLEANVMLSHHFIKPQKELWGAIQEEEKAKDIHLVGKPVGNRVSSRHYCRWFEYLVQLSIGTSMVKIYHEFGLELQTKQDDQLEMKEYSTLFCKVAELVQGKKISVSFHLVHQSDYKLGNNKWTYLDGATLEKFEPLFQLPPEANDTASANKNETYNLFQIAAAFSRTTREDTNGSSSGHCPNSNRLRDALTELFSKKESSSPASEGESGGTEEEDDEDDDQDDDKDEDDDQDDDEDDDEDEDDPTTTTTTRQVRRNP